MDEGDKLFVFCEHYRGDRNTDYASELKEIPLPTTGDHIWIDATCTEPKTCAACGLTEGEANGHSFVYALSEDAAGIIATCSAGNCPSGYNQNGITVILSAPEDLVYDGKAKEASISGYQPDVPDLEPEPEIIYYASAGEGSTEPSGGALPGAPSEEGSYVARITWGGQTASRAFTIVKEDAAVTSAPAAKKLTYSGAAQELVTAGKASGGTMAYSLTPDGTFTETIPKGTDAAGYTVYYKAIGDAYHNDSAVGGPVNVTISPAGQPITAAAGKPSLSVGKTTKITVTGAKGKVTYTSGDTGIAAVSSTGVVTAKKVGTVKITVSAAAIDNYKKTTKTVTIKVVPAATASFSAENQKTGIALSWKKVAGATGYYIYRNDTQIKKITSGSTLTFTDTKATGNATKYTYKIKAYASTGTSTLSGSRIIYGVEQPTISLLTNSGAGKMTVKWAKNTKGTGYQIQYSRYKSFSSKKTIDLASKNYGSKAITGLTKGKTYYVRVRTYKTVSGKKYYSAWSPTKSVKITK